MPPRRRSNLSRYSRNTMRQRKIRKQFTEEQRKIIRERSRIGMARLRESQTEEQRATAREKGRLLMKKRRTKLKYEQRKNLLRASIGPMDVVCKYCGALKCAEEMPGSCCFNGKVEFSLLTPPSDPLHSLTSDETPKSQHYLGSTQNYNGFPVISLEADAEHLFHNDDHHEPHHHLKHESAEEQCDEEDVKGWVKVEHPDGWTQIVPYTVAKHNEFDADV